MRKFVAILFCVMAMAPLANAGIVTYTINFSDNYSGTFDISQVLSVPQFNASLGALQSVKVDFGVSADGWIGIENTNPNNGITNRKAYTYTYYLPPTDPEYDTTHGNLKLSLGASDLASVDWNVANTYTLNLSVFDGTVDYAGTSGFLTVYLAEADSGSVLYNSGLEPYIGSGTVNFDLVGSAWFVGIFPSGNVNSEVSTLGAGNVTVTYEYVPEPATVCLLGLGVLSLIRRKHRA